MQDLPAGRLVVLAGPGVVERGCVDGLRALAAAGHLGVANTWGAKGVFRWDSPHHLGTCGLQERDFELLGFAGYDAIVATGIDPAEAPPERFALAPVVELAPEDLADAAASLHPRSGPVPENELYARLSAIAQPGYVDERVPLHPARAVAELRAAVPEHALVAAEPGFAGLWVARTFPTTHPGSVLVPASATPGAVAVAARGAATAGRPSVVVTTPEREPRFSSADAPAAPLVVVVWGADAPVGAAAHRRELVAALAEPGVHRLEVAVDLALTRLLVAAAGPVVAWGGRLTQDGGQNTH